MASITEKLTICLRRQSAKDGYDRLHADGQRWSIFCPLLGKTEISMSGTFLTRVSTPDGEVVVMTKTRYLLLFRVPRTSIMPWQPKDLGRLGVQFQWTTKNRKLLERLHNQVIEILREVSLTDLRGIADVGIRLSSIGLPFIPADAPLPENLKQISAYIKRAI